MARSLADPSRHDHTRPTAQVWVTCLGRVLMSYGLFGPALLGICALAVGVGPVGAVFGQAGAPGPEVRALTDRALNGVVWEAPRVERAARIELDRMAAAGVTAVRAEAPLPGPGTLAHADSLGITVALDLPLSALTARQLRTAADTLGPFLDRLAVDVRAAGVRVAVGLGTAHDTTVPATCDALEGLTGRVRDRLPGATIYYVTPFRPEADRCAAAVDVVAVDLRDLPDPVARFEAWTQAASRPVVIGALGTWVQPTPRTGLLAPHSPEWQARELEQYLAHWRPDPSDPWVAYAQSQAAAYPADSVATMPTLFVARWQDRDGALNRQYGVHTAQGAPRPAARVLRGVYRGEQHVFAFPRGMPPTPSVPWVVLLGWVLLGTVAATYARRPLFQRAASRYFLAHGFYCDSVREGRETLPTVHALLLGVVSVATGTVVATVLGALEPAVALGRVVEALPSVPAAWVAVAVQQPTSAGLWASIATAGALLIWGGALALASRQWRALRADQMLMLVTWPCWPVLLWMIAGLVVASSFEGGAPVAAGAIAGGAWVTAAISATRVLRDVRSVTGMPGGVVAALGLLSPAATIMGVSALLATQLDVSITLLWHLFSRT